MPRRRISTKRRNSFRRSSCDLMIIPNKKLQYLLKKTRYDEDEIVEFYRYLIFSILLTCHSGILATRYQILSITTFISYRLWSFFLSETFTMIVPKENCTKKMCKKCMRKFSQVTRVPRCLRTQYSEYLIQTVTDISILR